MDEGIAAGGLDAISVGAVPLFIQMGVVGFAFAPKPIEVLRDVVECQSAIAARRFPAFCFDACLCHCSRVGPSE